MLSTDPLQLAMPDQYTKSDSLIMALLGICVSVRESVLVRHAEFNFVRGVVYCGGVSFMLACVCVCISLR